MTMQRAATQWQPAKYLAFERLRLRPALDLLDRVPQLPSEPHDPQQVRIVDLGAGTGNMASAFLQRWPQAHVTFVDASSAMLARARADHNRNATLDTRRCSYVEATFDTFAPLEPLDLIFSNAALQWVSADAHVTLVPRLLSFLKPGGVLALQIPDTRANAGCQLIVEAATQLGWADDVADVRWVTLERDPSFYYELLTTAGIAAERLDLWTTTYTQILDGVNPVADFLSSTALGPYLEALGGRTSARATQLDATYRALVLDAYVPQRDGRTLFPMTRMFLVATTSTSTSDSTRNEAPDCA